MVVEAYSKEIIQICKQHKVKSLLLFGSAAKGKFEPGQSDLDFAVTFTPDLDLLDYAHNYLSLAKSLESLFGVQIDLLWHEAVKNEVMRREIDENHVLMYAA